MLHFKPPHSPSPINITMAQIRRHCMLRMSPLRLARRSSTSLGFRPHPDLARSFSSHGQPPSPANSFLPMPFITETMGGAWLSYDIFSRLLKERIVCLYGEVSPRTSATIVAQLLYLEAENPDKPINMYINSPGGSITDGMAIYDTMTYVTPDIITICMGQAASMGSLLLCAGAPGHRFALPNASIMMHQPSGGYFGQATDVAIHAKEILRVKKRLIETYRTHMAKEHTSEEIESLIERDRFMTADEALEFGLIDRIFTRRGDK